MEEYMYCKENFDGIIIVPATKEFVEGRAEGGYPCKGERKLEYKFTKGRIYGIPSQKDHNRLVPLSGYDGKLFDSPTEAEEYLRSFNEPGGYMVDCAIANGDSEDLFSDCYNHNADVEYMLKSEGKIYEFDGEDNHKVLTDEAKDLFDIITINKQ